MIAEVLIAAALVAIIAELIAEFLIEFVGQLVFEIFIEGLGWGFGRSERDQRSTDPKPERVREPTNPPGLLRWSAAIVVGLAFGIWRGNLADTFTWGFALAVAVALAAVIAASAHQPIERPDDRWRRLFLWWPSDRLYWFATANTAFVVGYLLAGL